MRFAFLLPAALLATGCGVPDVHFTPAGPPHDASAADGADEAAADAEGGAADAADASDAPTDAPDYCTGDAGEPAGFKCCMGVSGVVCGGNMCTSTACTQCATIGCSWPKVCCPGMGTPATCKPAGGC